MAKQLTDKQKRFVKEYLIDLNATQACIRAGYSPNYADRKGHELIENNRVSEAIAIEMAERSRRTGINQDRVLREIAKLALVNIDDVVDLQTARIKPTALKEDLACIQSIKIKPTEFGEEREIKFYDKKGSLELAGKHLGMFRDRVELEADMDLNIEIDYGDDE